MKPPLRSPDMMLKLEIGKTYVDTSGNHVTIIGRHPNNITFDFVGCRLNDVECYTEDGLHQSRLLRGTNNLIREHVEPVAVERWVRVYRSPDGKTVFGGRVYDSESDAANSTLQYSPTITEPIGTLKLSGTWGGETP